MLRSHLALWRGEAGEFLNYGRRVASPALAVPAVEIVFVEKDGTKRPQTVPTVLHAKWQLANGRVGTIFACIAEKPVEFAVGKERVRLEPGEAAFLDGVRPQEKIYWKTSIHQDSLSPVWLRRLPRIPTGT